MTSTHLKTVPALLLAALAAACGGGSGGGSDPTTYDVTVTKVGTGTGTVRGSGITCGSTCSKAVEPSASVTLTATPGTTSIFAGWGGACAAATNDKCTLSAITADQAVTATFTLVNKLTVAKVGAGSGVVSADPQGVACGFQCLAFEPGTSVTLSASARPDSSFAGWSGDCTGTTCVVELSAARSVTASFTFDPESTTCWLPSTLAWTSSEPIAEPAEGWVALKDFTHVPYDGGHLVYMTTHDAGTDYGAAWMTFADWPDAATATQTATAFDVVAPTLLYFTPTDQWVLAYQWGSTNFSYRTSDGLDEPLVWSDEHSLYNSGAPGAPYGPIDQTLICDAEDCYLFFAGDNGKIYRSSLPIENFPGTFGPSTVIMTDTAANLFEAVQVYSVKGTGEYLMIVEAQGTTGRYFRAFTATDLGGEWTPVSGFESKPFAGAVNVTFDSGTAWTPSISHGDLVRDDPSELMPVDACNLQLLYQGNIANNPTYDLIPWRPGLLTLSREQ